MSISLHYSRTVYQPSLIFITLNLLLLGWHWFKTIESQGRAKQRHKGVYVHIHLCLFLCLHIYWRFCLLKPSILIQFKSYLGFFLFLSMSFFLDRKNDFHYPWYKCLFYQCQLNSCHPLTWLMLPNLCRPISHVEHSSPCHVLLPTEDAYFAVCP